MTIARLLTALILPTAAFAAQCDPPYTVDIGGMLPEVHTVLNGTIRVQTLLFSGSQAAKIVVAVQRDGSVAIRLYYPISDDERDLWDGPAGVFPSAIAGICGQDWYNKWGSQFQASTGHFRASVSPRSATTTPASGQASQNIVLADVNGDGHADNIYLDGNGIEAQLTDTNGNVTATKNSPAGFAATSLNYSAVGGDFNGDGKSDLAVAYYGDLSTNLGGTVFVYLGNGDGTFQSPQSFSAGANPGYIAAADFNHDGKLDLAVANVNALTVSVLPGNGNGTFQPPASYGTGTTRGGLRSFLVLDLNGDGNPDIAVTDGTQLAVLLNNGSGGFGQPLSTPVLFAPVYLAYADLNKDGKLDLAIAGSQNAIVLLFGKGDGTFQPPVSYATGNAPGSLGIAPFQDGSTLLVTLDRYTGSVWLMLLAEDGSTGAPLLNTVGGTLTSVAAGDLNGDGLPDIVAGGNKLSVLLTHGGQLASPVTYSPAPQAVAMGDMNNDGELDVVAASSGALSVLLGDGTGALAAPKTTTVSLGAQSAALGDFNGDGKLDAAVAAFGVPPGSGSDTGGVVVLLGKGDGTFQTPTVMTAGMGRPVWVATADLNGDGKLDLAVVMVAPDHSIQPEQLAIFLGKGDGTFASPLLMTLKVKVFAFTQVAIGDLNGDHIPDLAVSSDQNGVDILLGQGDGTFREIAPPTADLLLTGVAISDINGDGKLDLLLLSDDGGYLLGNGDGTFQTQAHVNSGLSPVGIAVAKTSGAANPLLVYADQNTSVVALTLASPPAGSSAPVLTSGTIANGATYVAGGLVPGSWAQVQGTGLSSVTRTWSSADFAGLGNNLPTALSGVQVMVNNLPAAVYYIDASQVNFQVPNGILGTASVQVINNGVSSNIVTGTASDTSPAIFPITVNGTNYPAAVFTDGKFAGDPAIGSAFRAAHPGETVQLYATGLASTPAGVLPAPQSVSGVSITIGNAPPIQPTFAGLVAVGEFQVDFNVPQLPAGSYPISITVDGVSSPGLINSRPPGAIVLPIQP
jgi:uncharacterized protein (TIGR03437 family)